MRCLSGISDGAERKNRDMEIMLDYRNRTVITLGELMPHWWGEERLKKE